MFHQEASMNSIESQVDREISLPTHAQVVIIGGGVIGLELGMVYQKLGTKKAPSSAAGRMYHWIPSPSRLNIMAKGSYEPSAGCAVRKISISATQLIVKMMVLARFWKRLSIRSLTPLIFWARSCTTMKGHNCWQ